MEISGEDMRTLAMRDTNINLSSRKERFPLLISYFRVAPRFCFKARVTDKQLMSKLMIFYSSAKTSLFHTWLPFKPEMF